MKKTKPFIKLAIIISVFLSGLFIVPNTFAACPEGSVPVSIIGSDDMIVEGTEGERCLADDGSGSSINHILELVLNIMSIGVGILGVIGITIAGIQYLTAGDSEEKTKKAKRRIFEIIIGLVAYAMLFLLVGWLNRGANVQNFPSSSSSSQNGGSGQSPSSAVSSNDTSTPKFVKKGKKIYLEANGKKLTGRQKVNGKYYYFSPKTGEMKTGFVAVKKNGKTKYYYYQEKGSKKGQQVFGTKKIKGPYNGTKTKDTWYFNKRTGAVEGVKLAVKEQHQESQCGCGPTSTAMILTYLSGKHITECMVECAGRSCTCSASLGYCPDDEHYYALDSLNSRSAPYYHRFGYYFNDAKKDMDKQSVLNQLFQGKPVIFQSPPRDDNPYATEMGFTMGSGHFLVIYGYRNGKFLFRDPGGRITEASWSLLKQVDFSDNWFPTSWHFLKGKGKKKR